MRPIGASSFANIIFLALFAAAWLVGCGGGGGGNNNPLVFTPNAASVSFDYNQGAFPAAQVITISASGTYTGTLYVAAIASGVGLAATIPVSVNGTTATAQLLPATNLAPGSYSGTVKIEACSDADCNQQVGNSPLTVTFSITVHAVLQLTPSTLNLTAVSDSPTTQTIAVQPPEGQTTFTTMVQSGSPWLTVSNSTASGFDVTLASLPSGSYRGSVLVTSGNETVTLTVAYTVTAPAGGDQQLAVQPTSLTLSTAEDSSIAAVLTVTPPSWNPQVTATDGYPTGAPGGWLTVTPATGGFQVKASAANLIAGSYTAQITVAGAFPAANIVVPVALTVGVGLAKPAAVTVTLTAETSASALTGIVPVNVVAGPAVAWTATSDTSWLVLTTSSGNTGGSLSFTIDATQIAALANAASYPAHITITPARTTMSPMSFTVTLAKQLPQITSLAPYVQLTGQNARVILRGSGFSAIAGASLDTRFTLDGAAATSVSLVNDTEVVAIFAPLQVGTHTAAVSNALGMATPMGSVTAITAPSPAYSYTRLSSGGYPGYVAYDPQRNSVYVANTSLEEILRYHFENGAWTTTSLALPAAHDVGLSTDGTVLYATTSTNSGGTVESLDPDTLTTVTPPVTINNLEPTFQGTGFGVVPTNDGRSWLGIASAPGSDFGSLTYVTTGNLTPTIVQPPLAGAAGDTLGGPWFAASRDGELLIVTLSAQLTPEPPTLYLHAADSVLMTVPSSNSVLTSDALGYSLSETGNRVLLNSTLFDGSFNFVGNATLPTFSSAPSVNYNAYASVLSPDGLTLYVLAYGYAGSATSPSGTPVVFVFDAQTTSTNLNVLGYFTIPDFPSCWNGPQGQLLCDRAEAAISLDGHTLFFAGYQYFLVVPVPTTLSPVTSAQAGPDTKQQRRPVTTTWPLALH